MRIVERIISVVAAAVGLLAGAHVYSWSYDAIHFGAGDHGPGAILVGVLGGALAGLITYGMLMVFAEDAAHTISRKRAVRESWLARG